MTQHNSVIVKLSSSQLNKLKSAIKTATEVTLPISSNMVGDSNVRLISHINNNCYLHISYYY